MHDNQAAANLDAWLYHHWLEQLDDFGCPESLKELTAYSEEEGTLCF